MKLVKVKEVPTRNYNKVECYVEEFMQMNTPTVRVEIATKEYATVYSAAGSFRKAIKRLKLPVQATVRDRQLYLIRTDM